MRHALSYVPSSSPRNGDGVTSAPGSQPVAGTSLGTRLVHLARVAAAVHAAQSTLGQDQGPVPKPFGATIAPNGPLHREVER